MIDAQRIRQELEGTFAYQQQLEYPKLPTPPRRPREPARRVGQTVRASFAEEYRRALGQIEATSTPPPEYSDRVVDNENPMRKVERPKPDPVIITAPGHTQKVFDMVTFPQVAEWAAKHIVDEKIDAIAACGHSGLVIAGAVSILTKVKVFAVRKHNEKTVAASGAVSAVAHDGPAQRWCWLDDMTSSGGTLVRSIKRLHTAGLIVDLAPALALYYTGYGDDERGYAGIGGNVWSEEFPDTPQPREILTKRWMNRND